MKGRLRRLRLFFSILKNLHYLQFSLRSGLLPALLRTFCSGALMQEPLRWEVPFPGVTNSDQLARWLRNQGVTFVDAEHTIYIPPHQAIRQLVPEIVSFYPQGSGFKILKDLRGPTEANYLAARAGSVLFRRWLTGPILEHLITANYMYSLELGPRMWDICCWYANGATYTVFVMEHVEGDVPSDAECRQFLTGLEGILGSSLLSVLLPSWKGRDDFTSPSCRGNLIRSRADESLSYVDFQNFRLRNVAAWRKQVVDQANLSLENHHKIPRQQSERSTRRKVFGFLRPEVNSIPGKLRELGVDVDERVLIDCRDDIGVATGAALADGTKWGFVYRPVPLMKWTEQYLYALGASRFSILDSRDLVQDLPQLLVANMTETVILFQLNSTDQEIGTLWELPWRSFVLEGVTGMDVDSLWAALPVSLRELSDQFIVRPSHDSDSNCSMLGITRR